MSAEPRRVEFGPGDCEIDRHLNSSPKRPQGSPSLLLPVGSPARRSRVIDSRRLVDGLRAARTSTLYLYPSSEPLTASLVIRACSHHVDARCDT